MVSGTFRLRPGSCKGTPQSAAYLLVPEAGGRRPWAQAGPMSREASHPEGSRPSFVLTGHERREHKLSGLLYRHGSHHEAPLS